MKIGISTSITHTLLVIGTLFISSPSKAESALGLFSSEELAANRAIIKQNTTYRDLLSIIQKDLKRVGPYLTDTEVIDIAKKADLIPKNQSNEQFIKSLSILRPKGSKEKIFLVDFFKYLSWDLNFKTDIKILYLKNFLSLLRTKFPYSKVLSGLIVAGISSAALSSEKTQEDPVPSPPEILNANGPELNRSVWSRHPPPSAARK